ncbi:MAG: sn-glycerol-3-phosphate ABC transporter ATP-binding protein UgpC [Phycisphaera sp.]|nr:MAG: sn-glycerol-3-phosphate ABC transporter ATP-binding protein UgpC [Phycisphaera sp.]
MTAVELNNVWKIYAGDVAAVKDVNLSIQPGEFVVLVGPSGCGKSTTLRMIAGLESISKGEISIGNRVVNDVAPKDRDIAMVFQNYALYPHMTVEKNIAFSLKISGMPKDDINKRVQNVSEVLGLHELLKRKPGALSGGQRQRVALGRAIARDPKVFLFDEPLSNLDAKLRIAMRTEMKSLHQRLATTTVYVTHDQEEAMTLGSRLVVMNAGQIQQVGTPIDIYNYPNNRFVAGFVGSPAMNFIEGKLRVKAGETHFSRNGLDIFTGSVSYLPDTESDAVIGVRPQSIMLVQKETPGAIAATVDQVEPLGDQMDIKVRIHDDTVIIARVPLQSGVDTGLQIHIAFDAEKVHFFENSKVGARLNRRS